MKSKIFVAEYWRKDEQGKQHVDQVKIKLKKEKEKRWGSNSEKKKKKVRIKFKKEKKGEDQTLPEFSLFC